MIPRQLEHLLRSTGLPWSVESGTRHRKLILAGRLVGILPLNSRGREGSHRELKNIMAQVKRAIREGNQT